MRAGISAGPVWIGGRIPGPTAANNALGFIVCLPFYLLAVVIYGLAVAVWLIGAVLWLLVWTVKAIGYVLYGLTAPLWLPIRGWWRHHNRVLVRKVERRTARANARAFAAPPKGARQG